MLWTHHYWNFLSLPLSLPLSPPSLSPCTRVRFEEVTSSESQEDQGLSLGLPLPQDTLPREILLPPYFLVLWLSVIGWFISTLNNLVVGIILYLVFVQLLSFPLLYTYWNWVHCDSDGSKVCSCSYSCSYSYSVTPHRMFHWRMPYRTWRADLPPSSPLMPPPRDLRYTWDCLPAVWYNCVVFVLWYRYHCAPRLRHVVY